MGRNAQRRHAKAVRRKNLLAERRRGGMTGTRGTLAEEVRRATAAPLHSCLLQKAVFESGIGMVILTRKTTRHKLALAGFLVDSYCLGVKDAFFREADEAEMEELIDDLGTAGPFEAVDPSYAPKAAARRRRLCALARTGARCRLCGNRTPVRRCRRRRLRRPIRIRVPGKAALRPRTNQLAD